MHKGAAAKQQYSARSGSFATRGSSSGLDLLGVGVGQAELIDLGQRQQILRTTLQRKKDLVIQHNDRLTNRLPRATRLAVESERAQLITAILALEKELSDIKKTLTGHRNASLGQYLIEVCQEMMTKPQWSAIRIEAERRQAAALQKAENVLHD